MIVITHFAHPTSLDADEMFILRAESALWGTVLQDKVGDQDMFESAELLYSRGMHPQYRRHLYLVASDVDEPTREEHVLGVASLELPMVDNPRLATLGVVVRKDRRGEGIGSALHSSALEVVRQQGRTTIQAWTWEPDGIPSDDVELPAQTGSGGVAANSPESSFLTEHGYVLGQCERISRLRLPGIEQASVLRDTAVGSKPRDYELITIRNDVPHRLFPALAELYRAMGSDAPSGAMDLEDEAWDADRVRDSMDEVKTGNRDQLLTVVRHVPSERLVAFTRIFRDRGNPEAVHQWETLVVQDHRGLGLGMLMKAINHAAVAEFWPDARRLITGNASENIHMLAINKALGFESYAANGFWERRLRGSDS